MKKLRLVVALATLFSFALCAQNPSNNRVFAPNQKTYNNNVQTVGGTFEVNCKPSFAASCYQDYMKGFKTKRQGRTDFITEGLGGSVRATITGSDNTTYVELVVTNAAFPDLTKKLSNYINASILQDTFRRQKNILDGMVSRKANCEKDNVNLTKKIERLKVEIANCETKIMFNSGAIEKYAELIEEQKGYVAQIQSQIDELLADMPNK